MHNICHANYVYTNKTNVFLSQITTICANYKNDCWNDWIGQS